MTEHLTEEEQVEALKKWWKENGMAVVIGIAIGLSAVVGVRYWFSHQEQQAAEASFIYNQLVETSAGAEQLAADPNLQRLQSDYTGTPYAALAAMHAARAYVDQGKFAEAEQLLRWAVQNPGHESLRLAATVLLARVLLATDKTDEALQLVDQKNASVFASRYAEIRGDIYRQRGDALRAREAYQVALADSNLPGKLREYIEMKVQDLPDTAGGEKSE